MHACPCFLPTITIPSLLYFVSAMFSLALAATTALSLASLVSAQSPLDIAVIEAHFTNAGIVPDLLKTFVPSATLNASFSGVGAITPGEALSKDRMFSSPLPPPSPYLDTYTLRRGCAGARVDDQPGQQLRHVFG
jgi:hypothetical protein